MPPKSAPKAKAAAGSDHPSYQAMITDAIIALKERSGSSRAALKKYVASNNKNVPEGKIFDSLFNRALKGGVAKGVFEQPKGPSGGTKLAKKEPKPAAAAKPKTAVKKATATKPATKPATKKPAAKKATATTTKKAPAVKKTAAKPAAKKAAAPKKAAVAKKPAAKKAAPKAKKPAAPKAAPAVVEKPTVLSKTKSGRVTKTSAPKTTAAKKAAPKKKSTPKKATPKASA